MRWRAQDVLRASRPAGPTPEQRADIDSLQVLADAFDGRLASSEVAWLRSDIALRTADFRGWRAQTRRDGAGDRAGAVELGRCAQQRLAVARSVLGLRRPGAARSPPTTCQGRARSACALPREWPSAPWRASPTSRKTGSAPRCLSAEGAGRARAGHRRSTCTTLINLGRHGQSWASGRSRGSISRKACAWRASRRPRHRVHPLLRLAVLCARDDAAARWRMRNRRSMSPSPCATPCSRPRVVPRRRCRARARAPRRCRRCVRARAATAASLGHVRVTTPRPGSRASPEREAWRRSR